MSPWLIALLVVLGILLLPVALPLMIMMLIVVFALAIDVVYLPISLIKAIIIRIAGDDKTITIKHKEIVCDQETEENR